MAVKERGMYGREYIGSVNSAVNLLHVELKCGDKQVPRISTNDKEPMNDTTIFFPA